MMARLSAVVVLAVLLAIMLSGSAQSPLVAEQRRQNSSWTIMVYMADDFVSSLHWQDDFNEMEAALQAPGTSIIALVDPFGPGNSTLYKVEHDPNFLDSTIVSSVIDDNGVVISGGEVDMAAAPTLRSFIEFSVSSYPADNYVLILWGHGAGWRGLCPDGTGVLTLPELSDALSQATSTIGRRLDLIAVDSCAEAALETLWQIHDYSRLFVGSEKDVPFQGLPYATVMNDLAARPSQSVEEFASRIVDDYVVWSGSNTDYSVTMGVFDLTKMDMLVVTVNLLSAQGQKYDPIFHDVLRTALNSSESYEEAISVDFGHFMWKLQRADLPLEIQYYATDCLLESEEVVKYIKTYENSNPINDVHVGNASGFTMFAPSNSTQDDDYADLALATTHWFGFGRLLRNDTVAVQNGPGPTVSYSSSNASSYGMTLSLHPDPLMDTATLTWPDGIFVDSIWTFRNQSNGLVLLSSLTVYGSEFSVSYPGRLTLATSSYLDGKLYSYRTVNVTLEGNVSIVVQVTRDDRLASHLDDEYYISMVCPDGRRLAPAQLPPTGIDDSRLFTIRIPEDAIIGDIVTVEIVDKSSGDIVGTERVFVPRQSTTVDVEVVGPCECPFKIVVPLLFALLPGLLIIGFALSLHFQNRKEKGKREKTRISS